MRSNALNNPETIELCSDDLEIRLKSHPQRLGTFLERSLQLTAVYSECAYQYQRI